ncbi:MAG TPA: hypothetical protein VF292_00115 [Rhodanobacteraceae bacterium]
MRNRLDHAGMNADPALSAALRALPAGEPPHDGWPRLAARTRRRRTTRRVLWTGAPIALALIALAIAWPQVRPMQPAQPRAAIAQQAAPTPGATSVDLAALQTSSRQWQAWVSALNRNGAPLNGPALATAATLQDRIGLVDLQLSATRNPATAAGLWRHRITLLQQLGLLHLQPYAVAQQTAATHTVTVL